MDIQRPTEGTWTQLGTPKGLPPTIPAVLFLHKVLQIHVLSTVELTHRGLEKHVSCTTQDRKKPSFAKLEIIKKQFNVKEWERKDNSPMFASFWKPLKDVDEEKEKQPRAEGQEASL